VTIELASAAAYRRKKGDLVAGVERRAPGREFLIPRRYQRATVSRKLRAARDEAGKQILDARAGCELDEFLNRARRFFEAAEE
jgi:hypothetical protein